ncbi:MAG: hypothetical protein PHS41_06145, partial [Victivallaceae bacterium]|nr:hypothetical protein [Victivallaceae bacterium]
RRSPAIFFAEKGESRNAVATRIQAYPTLSAWAEDYRMDNFPNMLRLKKKYDPDTLSRLSKAFLMPVSGTFADLQKMLDRLPGTAIMHTPGYMRSPKGKQNRGWDAFPNYFPPNPRYGTQEEYRALTRAAVGKGHLFMPRNSFFYWADNSDADLAFDLKKLAMKRVDGKIRLAVWAIPGVLVSPSSAVVQKELDRFFGIWKDMGANAYFTNVIGAIGPWGNRYDFHPEAPAADLFYDQIYKMMRRHGRKIPLLSEGSGAFQLPWQAGFCGTPNWDPARPAAKFRMGADRGVFVRSVPEINLYLYHPYALTYPHNAGTSDGTESMPKLSYSLVYGIGLKIGIDDGGKKLNSTNLRYLRTAALLARDVWSVVYGDRCLRNERLNSGIVRTDYEHAQTAANFSEQEAEITLNGVRATIAPEGFFFVSNDHRTVAGFFSAFGGKSLSRPELVVLQYAPDAVTLYAPLATEEVKIQVPGYGCAVIPSAPAVMARAIPGVKLAKNGIAKPFDMPQEAMGKSKNIIGSAQAPAIPPVAAELASRFSPGFEYRKGDKLPSGTKLTEGSLSSAGLHLGSRGELQVTLPEYTAGVYLECIFRYRRLPAFGNHNGESNLMIAPVDGRRSVELRYNLHLDCLRFLVSGTRSELWDLLAESVSIVPDKYYHVIAWFDGETHLLEVNGVKFTASNRGKMLPCPKQWIIGDHAPIDFELLRIRSFQPKIPKSQKFVPKSDADTTLGDWIYAGDKSIPARRSATNTIEFTPKIAKHTWCYLFRRIGKEVKDRKGAPVKAVEFTLDYDIPKGMRLMVALQTKDEGMLSCEALPEVGGSRGSGTIRIERDDFRIQKPDKKKGRDLSLDDVEFAYIGAVGAAGEQSHGEVRLIRWALLP